MGSHGYYHLFVTEKLYKSDKAAFEKEIFTSKTRVEALTGLPSYFYAYPFGAFDQITKTEVARAGFEFALAVKPGFVYADARLNDDYELPARSSSANGWKDLVAFLARNAGTAASSGPSLRPGPRATSSRRRSSGPGRRSKMSRAWSLDFGRKPVRSLFRRPPVSEWEPQQANYRIMVRVSAVMGLFILAACAWKLLSPFFGVAGDFRNDWVYVVAGLAILGLLALSLYVVPQRIGEELQIGTLIGIAFVAIYLNSVDPTYVYLMGGYSPLRGLPRLSADDPIPGIRASGRRLRGTLHPRHYGQPFRGIYADREPRELEGCLVRPAAPGAAFSSACSFSIKYSGRKASGFKSSTPSSSGSIGRSNPWPRWASR